MELCYHIVSVRLRWLPPQHYCTSLTVKLHKITVSVGEMREIFFTEQSL